MTTDQSLAKQTLRDPVVLAGVVGVLITAAVSMIELDTVFNLPAHALLVHGPVVLLPLSALATFAVMLKDEWRERYGVVLMAVTLVAVAMTVMAAGAGEQLQEHVRNEDAVREHAEAGDTLRTIAFVYGIVMVAFITVDRYGRRRRQQRQDVAVKVTPLEIITRVVVVAVAALTMGWTAYTGHLGSKAVWGDQDQSGQDDRSSSGPGSAERQGSGAARDDDSDDR